MHRIIYNDCVSKNSKNSGLRSNRREAHLLTLDELTFMSALRLRPSATALGPIPVQMELIVEINISSEVFADAKLHKIFEIAKFASVKNVNRLILFSVLSHTYFIYIRIYASLYSVAKLRFANLPYRRIIRIKQGINQRKTILLQ